MIITHSLYFYAAHRVFGINEKCESLHGHTYYINFACRTQMMSGPCSTPFHEFDKLTDYIKDIFDHGTMISADDTDLVSIADKLGKHVILPEPTTVENLAGILFEIGLQLGFDVQRVTVQETTKNTIEYTIIDYESSTQSASSARQRLVKYFLS